MKTQNKNIYKDNQIVVAFNMIFILLDFLKHSIAASEQANEMDGVTPQINEDV